MQDSKKAAILNSGSHEGNGSYYKALSMVDLQ